MSHEVVWININIKLEDLEREMEKKLENQLLQQGLQQPLLFQELGKSWNADELTKPFNDQNKMILEDRNSERSAKAQVDAQKDVVES